MLGFDGGWQPGGAGNDLRQRAPLGAGDALWLGIGASRPAGGARVPEKLGGFWPLESGPWISRRSGGGDSAEEARQLARGYSFRIERIPPRAPQEKLSGGMSSSQAPYPSPRRCGLHIPRRRLRRLRAHSIAAPLPGANTSLVCAGSPFPSGTGSLIPLLLLFPPQTLRLLCGGSPIFPPVTPLKRPKEGGLRPPAFGIPPRRWVGEGTGG